MIQCPVCLGEMELHDGTQMVLGDLTCCGEKTRGNKCLRKDHAIYFCPKCQLIRKIDFDPQQGCVSCNNNERDNKNNWCEAYTAFMETKV